VDVRRSIRFGLVVAVAAVTGAAVKRVVVIGAVAGGEDGAAWKSAKSSSPPTFSLAAGGASTGSALFAPAAPDEVAVAVVAGSLSSKSSKFIMGAGAGSGALPAALDCAVDERVWLVLVPVAALVAVVRRGEVS